MTNLKLKLKLIFANKSTWHRASFHRHTDSSPKALEILLMIQSDHARILEILLYSLLFKAQWPRTTLGLQKPRTSCCNHCNQGYLFFCTCCPVVQMPPFFSVFPLFSLENSKSHQYLVMLCLTQQEQKALSTSLFDTS